MDDLWIELGNKCLSKASALLDSETVSTAETVETVRALVKIAIDIDWLNLQWEQQNRSGAAVFRGQPFSQKAGES